MCSILKREVRNYIKKPLFWIGIGGCLILWLTTNSSIGDRYLGVWNLFSYAFRDIENNDDFS